MAAAALRLRIWDPVADAIAGASRVFIVPDGAFNLVSFAALPVGNRYLLEAGPAIHYLSTERDLVRKDPGSGRGLLALGGPAFDVGVKSPAVAVRPSASARPTARRASNTIGSSRRNSGHREDSGGQDDVLVFSGRAATKMALTQAIVGRKVVHLAATHGFFLGFGCEPTMPRDARRGRRGDGESCSTDNPLGRSPGLRSPASTRCRGPTSPRAFLTRKRLRVSTCRDRVGCSLKCVRHGARSDHGGRRRVRAAARAPLHLRRAHDRHEPVVSGGFIDPGPGRRRFTSASTTNWIGRTPSAPPVSRCLKIAGSGRGSTHPVYWGAFVAAGDWR